MPLCSELLTAAYLYDCAGHHTHLVIQPCVLFSSFGQHLLMYCTRLGLLPMGHKNSSLSFSQPTVHAASACTTSWTLYCLHCAYCLPNSVRYRRQYVPKQVPGALQQRDRRAQRHMR